MAEYRLVVLSNAVAGQAEAYNAWYDDTHLDDVLTVEGFTRAQRFVRAGRQVGDVAPTHDYLAIYDFETDDLDATIDRFLEVCASRMVITPSLAPDARPMVFEVLGPAKTR